MPEVELKPKKKNLLFRMLAFLVTLALVLGAVALVANRDKLNIDALARWIKYRSLVRSDTGQIQPFSYEGREDDRFADLNGDLLVCSSVAARLYSAGGVKYLDLPVALGRAAVSVGGKTAAVYDVGGTELRLISKRAEAFSLTLDNGGTLLSARLNENGYLAVTSREDGYKGVATVYDDSHKKVLALRHSSSYLMDAVVTRSNKALAAVSMGEGDGAFLSTLLLYSLDGGDEPYASCLLGNDVVLALESDNMGLWCVGDKKLYIVTDGGELQGSFSYDDRYLRGCNLGGAGFAALLLGKYQVGVSAELTTVGPDGKQIASVSLNEQVLSMSAAGRYVAILTDDRLYIYTKNLKPYATLESPQNVGAVVLRDDGSAFLVGSDTARLYLPD